MARTIQTPGKEFSMASRYHIGILLWLIAVVIVPIGSYQERAPYAFLAVLPEIIYPLDLILSILSNRKNRR